MWPSRFSTAIPEPSPFPQRHLARPGAHRAPLPQPSVRSGLATADMEAMMEAVVIVWKTARR
jgi:hypothetical protein